MARIPAQLRVLVAVEPYLLRSAVYAALSRDDRFDAVLVPQQGRVADCADVAGVVLVSEPVDIPGASVVILGAVEPTVQLGGTGGTGKSSSYSGLAELADLLAKHAGEESAA